MTTLSGFWTTIASGPTGDQQVSYTQAQWSIAAKVMSACNGFEGIGAGYLNSIVPAANGANTVSIGTGGAMVDGKWVNNDASVNVNIPSAVGGGNTRIDRIVLRASWAGFAVTITRIAGTDAASPTAPAIVQTPGTTYDIKICQVLVTTGGVVTVTDERVFAGAMVAGTVMIGAANTQPTPTALTGDVTVTSAGVTAIGALKVTNGMLAANSVDSSKVVDGSIVSGDLSATAGITDGQLVNGKVANRQGGSATNWSTSGTNNYVPSASKIQCGAGQTNGSGTLTITFPVAFSDVPLVFITTEFSTPPQTAARAYGNTASGFNVVTFSTGTMAVEPSIWFVWMAIGPG